LDDKTRTRSDGAARTYSLSLKGDGMTVDRNIDEATALQVLSLVMRSKGTITTPPPPTREPSISMPHAGAGGQSLREYLDDVEAKRNPDKILAVAKYLSNQTGKNFTRAEVRGLFQQAAEPVPGNYGRDFRWTVRNGWLAPVSGSKGQFYVTDAGDKALAAKFSAEIKRKTGVSKGRRGGRRRAKRTTSSG
jgi:hypothetical protein